MDNLLGLLRIRVKRGVNLAVRDVRSSDPYLVIKMGKQVCFLIVLIIVLVFSLLIFLSVCMSTWVCSL
uniref:Uncharacterized protein n=1 Tax=Nelumbo nucifera TaxID=4432 RepID=A0A822YMH8_NELNU|nr:TPA_asm: hypothetical protein HUJ06_010957 [Nelumbo nucifera]